MERSKLSRSQLTRNFVICLSALLATILSAGCTNLNSSLSDPSPKQSISQTSLVADPAGSDHPKNMVPTNPGYKSCADVLSVEKLYEFNPNFTYEPEMPPAPGSIGEKVQNENGTFCSYVNLSSVERLEITVQNRSWEDTKFIQKELLPVADATNVFGPGTDNLGYFLRKQELGTSIVLTPKEIFTFTSSIFMSPEDSSKLVALTIGHQ